MNGHAGLYQALAQLIPDNLEWELLFQSGEVIADTEARRVVGPFHASPWEDEPGARSRITPPDASIVIVDDCRVLKAFADWDTLMPRLLLAGERAEHAWPVTEELRVGIVTTGGNSPGLNEVVDSASK